MPKPDNQWQEMAAEAAERIDRQREQGQQLALLPDEIDDPVEDGGEARGVGRPKGAKNKVSSQMRDYLAARGCRLPEDVLIEVAGLNTRNDLVTLAMVQTERVLAWAFDGAHIGRKAAPRPTVTMRLDVFRQQYTMILRAAEALMPYMAPKATPDVNVNQSVTMVVPSAPSQSADPAVQARDVTPVRTGRMMPAQMRDEIQQKQQLKEPEISGSDGQIRTDDVSQ